MNEPFDDLLLGHVAWNVQRDCWEFDAGPVGGRSVPANARLPSATQGWDSVRACVHWLRANEPAVREYMAERLFTGDCEDWCEMEEVYDGTVALPDKFELAGIDFDENQIAWLTYRDGGLFGGHWLSVGLSAAGEFVAGPDMWG